MFVPEYHEQELILFKEEALMKMQDLKEIAKKNGVKAGKMCKTDLVLAIQKAEGNCECFATPYVSECNQVNCLWRADCTEV
jgi:Rho termination factor, N-terminal domain